MKTYTEEQLLKTLKEWGVSDEDQKALIESMGGSEDPKEVAEGGEPEEPIEDKKEDKAEAEATEGGEPEVGTETPTETEEPSIPHEDAYKQRFDALEARLSDIISSLEGLSAANKRNEEIIGSLGKRVEGNPEPFGDINSSKERTVDKSAEESAKSTMDAFGKLAGMR